MSEDAGEHPSTMPTYITIGYGDEAGYARTSQDARDAAHAHDARLRGDGVLMGMAGDPVQVRNHEGAAPTTTPGQYLRADLPVAGFAVIEAADLDEAIRLAADSPCAVAHGVVEVWPLQTPTS